MLIISIMSKGFAGMWIVPAELYVVAVKSVDAVVTLPLLLQQQQQQQRK